MIEYQDDLNDISSVEHLPSGSNGLPFPTSTPKPSSSLSIQSNHNLNNNNQNNNHNNYNTMNGNKTINGNHTNSSNKLNGHSNQFSSFYNFLDNFFSISDRNSSIHVEIRSGFVTFFTMAYILVVNAEVLSKSGFDKHGEKMNFDSIATATALSAAIGSALVGILGNLPFGLAPGMGLNSYFTYGVCLRAGLDWHIALTCVFVQGILFMILSLLGACNLIQLYAPPCIKKSITVGLGLFQALIGFECMKLVVPGTDVLLQLGDISDPRITLAMVGMLLICCLLILDVKASMLIGMVVITVISWVSDLSPYPQSIIQSPSFSNTFFALDIAGFFHHYSVTIPVTLMFLFVAIFDTAGVQFMAGQQAGLLDENDILPGAKSAFFSAGLATSFGALLGTSPVIIHNETCAGIQDGARTGLSSVVIAICFLFSIPFIPILRAVPAFATAPPLVIVGMFMMMAAKYIEWERVDEAMPAFLTATILPLTYSIANGMISGIIAFVVLKSGAFIGGRLTGKGVGAEWSSELTSRLQTPRDINRESTFLGEKEKLLGLDVLNGRGRGSSSASNTAIGTPRSGSIISGYSKHSGVASGIVSFDDPMPGSPIPPFVDRKASTAGRSGSYHSPLMLNSANSTRSPASIPPAHGYGTYNQ